VFDASVGQYFYRGSFNVTVSRSTDGDQDPLNTPSYFWYIKPSAPTGVTVQGPRPSDTSGATGALVLQALSQNAQNIIATHNVCLKVDDGFGDPTGTNETCTSLTVQDQSPTIMATSVPSSRSIQCDMGATLCNIACGQAATITLTATIRDVNQDPVWVDFAPTIPNPTGCTVSDPGPVPLVWDTCTKDANGDCIATATSTVVCTGAMTGTKFTRWNVTVTQQHLTGSTAATDLGPTSIVCGGGCGC
jgi:hypothetical protein